MRAIVAFAALSGFVAVALGAAAAHALKRSLDAQSLDWIETGVRYQAWHAAALLGVAALMALRPAPALGAAAVAFALGTVLFSGSLYALAFSGTRAFAHLAPLGGFGFLVGWAALFWYAIRA
jgi:uncharacterized membrane protein YgdD (TMEM256/DUF423 family)